MTWAELHGTLRGRGLIRADDALRAEAAVGVVTGIAYDSRAVAPGEVFVALKGQHRDGTAFARQAIERGAAAVVSEQPAPADIHIPWAIVEDARLAMAVLAGKFSDGDAIVARPDGKGGLEFSNEPARETVGA